MLAACWSPATPRIGMDPPNKSVAPKSPALSRTSGNTARGTPNSLSNSASQSNVFKFNSMVREALVVSVACTRPLVRFQISQLSMVPNAISPAFAFCRAPFTFFRSHSSLVAEK